jgi:hypothetical protein
MTPGERALWLAVFGASWHQSTGNPSGHVDDGARAVRAMATADRAVNAVQRGDLSLSDYAEEVLRG